jgi:hypothetical protein
MIIDESMIWVSTKYSDSLLYIQRSITNLQYNKLKQIYNTMST